MKIILSGPSGAGKDTLIDMWIEANPHVKRAITATTRAPRTGEVNGKDYYFYTIEEMESKIANGEFLEHMNVHGNIYGTPRSSVEEIVNAGGTAIIRIDVQGAIELIPKMPDAVSIFILPPSLEELRRRIETRNLDSKEKMEERLNTAVAEIMCSYFYDHQVINDTLEVALGDLQDILDGAVFINSELADECMLMELNEFTHAKIEQFLALAEKAGVSSKNPQVLIDKQ